MPETKLHFSDVTFNFGKGKPLFENLSCSLANDSATGKIIALMGPSGVGKTTFCDLILGVHQPQKGSVEFTPKNANIAVIPQKGVIFDELSVIENISCLKYSKNLGKSFHNDKVKHAVQSLDLSRVLESGTRASVLSGGEAQRVMLARIQTIVCDLLVLDEPCSFLDNRVKDSFLTALRTTVDESQLLAIMVTHVWDEARQVADEAFFFHQTPGKPVSLHKHSIAEANDYPPTIDALFGIHWPDCVLIDLAEDAQTSSLLGQDIPHDARFLGLFKNGCGNSENKDWADRLWREAKQANHFSGRLPQAKTSAPAEDSIIATAFYNADGLLIKRPSHKI